MYFFLSTIKQFTNQSHVIWPLTLGKKRYLGAKPNHYVGIIPKIDQDLFYAYPQFTIIEFDGEKINGLIDVTLACEDAYSKLVEDVTVDDVSDEDRVGNSLLQIWKLRFCQKN